MNIKYTNRAGKIYYLHIGKTNKGTDKYFFSRKRRDLAERIPNGYEIYENVNAQVFLRKIQPKTESRRWKVGSRNEMSFL
jgi:hypothetical protein